MADDETPKQARWQRWVGLALLMLPVVLILVPLFQYSENLHTSEETTSWERVTLGLRTFWPEPTSSFWNISGWQVDTNVPLGSAVVFSLPHALDLEAVFWSRAIAAGAALLAMVGLYRILEPAVGGLAAALGAIWPWSVPAFSRGAVVSGEEAMFTAAIVCAVLGLVGRGRWLILSVLAANAMVFVRLDGAIVLPGYALLAFLLLSRKQALLVSFLSGWSIVLHLVVTWATTGHPLTFMRTAKRVTDATSAGGAALSPMRFLEVIGGNLGGTWVLALGLVGAVLLVWRGGERGRALGVMALWVALAYGVVGVRGTIKLEFARYTVPTLALLAACAGGGFGVLAGAPRTLLPLVGAAALGFCFHTNVPTMIAEAEEARLSPGVEGAAHWLAVCGKERTVLVTDHPFAFSVIGPLRPERVVRVRTRYTTPTPEPMLEQLGGPDVAYLAIVGSGPVEQLVREARAPGWAWVWQEQAVTIYAKADEAERRRLIDCSRWD